MLQDSVVTPEQAPWEQEERSFEDAQKEILESLTQPQREAVLHDQGPLLIIAGAGTGKTKVITHRIARLITSKAARPDQILALTFTDKAAAEMEERVDVLLPYGYNDVWISTFHSFGDRLLREHAFDLGLPDDFQVLSQPEQIVFLREHLFDLPLKYFRTLSDPTRYLSTLSRFISRVKDEDITPQDYLAHVAQLEKDAVSRVFENSQDREAHKEELAKQKELATLFKAYQALMAKHGKLDFGDQIVLTLKLLRDHPSVLKEVQERFRYILVDEFQDTNYAQFELVKLLAQGHSNVTVVGDDDQSIFKFRGAAVSNILNFEKIYPQAKRVVLTDNYRSTQSILDSAYSLITNNNPDRLEVKDNISKKLTSHREEPGKAVGYFLYDSVSTEADAVAKMIKEKLTQGVLPREIALLVRSNREADPFLKALTMENVPWRFSGNAGLYSRPETQLLLAFLRSLAGPLDSISLFHLASSEIYAVPMDDLVLCHQLVRKTNRPLLAIFERLDSFEELKDLPQPTRALIGQIVKDRTHYLELSRTTSPARLLYKFLSDKGYLKSLIRAASSDAEEKVQNLSRFFKIVEKFENAANLTRVAPFVAHLDQLIEAGDDPPATEADPDDPAVSVFTLHKAKGLEFSCVYLVGLAQQRFPVRKRSEPLELPEALIKDILPAGDYHLQEERRLFYVGMTRAKDELVITSAKDYGGRRLHKPSVFVTEALGEPARDSAPQKRSAQQYLERQGAEVQGSPSVKPVAEEKPLQLSAKAVEDYLSCPLKYKFSHVLRVPRGWNHTIVYGLALHKAVEDYYTRRMNGQTMGLDELLGIFKDAWQSEGFESLEHEQLRFDQGQSALKRFFEKADASSAVPAFVEKEFKFSLENNIRLIGRFDRVDQVGGETKIIDYKSSEVNDQKKADKKIAESVQMAVYALAWKETQGRYPEKVELHFLDSGLVGSLTPDEEYAEGAKEKILSTAQGIRQGKFDADPVFMACNYCSYAAVCPSADIVK